VLYQYHLIVGLNVVSVDQPPGAYILLSSLSSIGYACPHKARTVVSWDMKIALIFGRKSLAIRLFNACPSNEFLDFCGCVRSHDSVSLGYWFLTFCDDVIVSFSEGNCPRRLHGHFNTPHRISFKNVKFMQHSSGST
jgi:hypothetical protein